MIRFATVCSFKRTHPCSSQKTAFPVLQSGLQVIMLSRWWTGQWCPDCHLAATLQIRRKPGEHFVSECFNHPHFRKSDLSPLLMKRKQSSQSATLWHFMEYHKDEEMIYQRIWYKEILYLIGDEIRNTDIRNYNVSSRWDISNAYDKKCDVFMIFFCFVVEYS